MAEDLVPAGIRVIRLEGPVRCSLDGGNTWKMLKKGEVLHPGVLVETAREKSLVDLQLSGSSVGKPRAAWQSPDANLVRLYANSALELKNVSGKSSDPSRVEEVNLDLRSGQVLAKVAQTSPPSRYEMTVPKGAVGPPHGAPQRASTVFVLKASGDLTVFTGSMVIANVDTDVHTQLVSAGEKFEVATGKVSQLLPDDPESKLWPP
jgi:hypothetical protein